MEVKGLPVVNSGSGGDGNLNSSNYRYYSTTAHHNQQQQLLQQQQGPIQQQLHQQQLQLQYFHCIPQHQTSIGGSIVWKQQQGTLYPVTIQPIPFNASLHPLLATQHLSHSSSSFQTSNQQQRFAFNVAPSNHIPQFPTTDNTMTTTSTTHNLIPLRSCATAIPISTTLNNSHVLVVSANNNHNASLHGTPGYPPAIIYPQQQQLIGYNMSSCNNNLNTISLTNEHHPLNETKMQQSNKPIYTVRERPFQQPVYNGVNLNYPGLRCILQQDYCRSHPPIYCVDNFLTDEECQFLIDQASDSFGPAPVVGKGSGEVSPSRTSSTCYLAREDVPDLVRKVSILTGKPIEHCELPQVGRYFPSQQYLQHYDAFDLRTEDGRRFASNGGQRTVTVLIYLNTVARGGATYFPTLDIKIQPVRGMAVLFFPATIDGLLDEMALHAALPAIDTKYVSQIWIRQSTYTGQPSKRLSETLGIPFGSEQHVLQQHQQISQLENQRKLHDSTLQSQQQQGQGKQQSIHDQGTSDMQF